MKHLKQFSTTAEYNAAKSSLILPNVSVCQDAPTTVYYNPNSPTPPVETRLIAKYNVTDTSNPTEIYNDNAGDVFTAMEVDGVNETISTGYTFSTTGEHTIKFTLNEPTDLYSNTFAYCENLISVVLPNSITNTHGYAFEGCSALTSCTLSENITDIGSNSFNECTSLSSITIPNGVINIEPNAFKDCKSLTSVIIPESVTYIGHTVFSGCTSLTDIVIPNNVDDIEEYAFYYCPNLTSVTIGSSVEKLNYCTFAYCESLNTITSLSTIAPSLDYYVFYGVSETGTLYIPQGSNYSSWLSVLGSGWTTAPIQ